MALPGTGTIWGEVIDMSAMVDSEKLRETFLSWEEDSSFQEMEGPSAEAGALNMVLSYKHVQILRENSPLRQSLLSLLPAELCCLALSLRGCRPGGLWCCCTGF